MDGDGKIAIEIKRRNLGEGVDEIAVSIALEIERVRLANGVERTEIGEALDVREQQVKKLLKGESHLSAARLVVLSQVLDVPVVTLLRTVTEAGPMQELAHSEQVLLDGFRSLDSGNQRVVLTLVDALQGDDPGSEQESKS